jgi:hypothetical protein
MKTPTEKLTVPEYIDRIETARGEDRENILLLLKEDCINMNQADTKGTSEVFGLTREEFQAIFKATGNEMTFQDLIRGLKNNPPATQLKIPE